jgi:hypothetical protein
MPRGPQIVEWKDPVLGVLRWDGAADCWTTTVSIGRDTVEVWIGGRDQPDPRDLAYAAEVVQSFEAFQQKVDVFLRQEAKTAQLERWSDEIVSMTIRLLAFSSEAEPGRVMIFFQTSDDAREWRLECHGGHFEQLSFDT